MRLFAISWTFEVRMRTEREIELILFSFVNLSISLGNNFHDLEKLFLRATLEKRHTESNINKIFEKLFSSSQNSRSQSYLKQWQQEYDLTVTKKEVSTHVTTVRKSAHSQLRWPLFFSSCCSRHGPWTLHTITTNMNKFEDIMYVAHTFVWEGLIYKSKTICVFTARVHKPTSWQKWWSDVSHFLKEDQLPISQAWNVVKKGEETFLFEAENWDSSEFANVLSNNHLLEENIEWSMTV